MRKLTIRDAEALGAMLRAAGQTEIMPRFRNLDPAAIRTKSGPLDLVTDADEAGEALISAALARCFPEALVIGEEAAAADPRLLGKLRGAELAVVVDPLDGTANFCAGLPLFGVMAAVVVQGEVALGVIHDPVTDHTAFALRGEGAWEADAAGRRRDLRVAAPAPVERMTGVASWRYLPPPLRETVLHNLPKVAQSWNHRCAAHEYRSLAAGSCHYLLFNRLLPWDHLPGWLLHREAGGYSAHFDGSPHRPEDTRGGLICTPDAESWRALKDALFAD